MATYIIENDFLTVCVDEFGAELHSIINRQTNQEYLWHGDAAYWGRRSPVLFPFVGSLNNKEYTYNETIYSMGQHGFARDMEFQCIKKTESSVTFQLNSTEETLLKYPFTFILEITYTLVNNNIEVEWFVKNTNDKTMYFSIGGHPAFLCPLVVNEKQTDYSIEFDTSALTITNINSSGLAMTNTHTITLNQGILPITADLFDRDALVIENDQSHVVTLRRPDDTPYLRVSFDAPLFGIWSPAKKQAPFVCIEPWYGRCDSEDFNGDLSQRKWSNTLEASQHFVASYTISILS